MPYLSETELLQRVILSIHESGWPAVAVRDRITCPLHLRASKGDTSVDLTVYLWEIEPHRSDVPSEQQYSVRTSAASPCEAGPGGERLILGWWERAGVFAGFDPRKYSSRDTAFPPSLRVARSVLRAACAYGLATDVKGDGEVAVAFRSDLLMYYAKNARDLHNLGQSQHDHALFNALAADPYGVSEEDIASVTDQRRHLVLTAATMLRERSFRRRVLSAYEHRCAMCKGRAGHAEAVHIVPVGVRGGTDSTSNGIALCATHRAAYEEASVAVDDDHRVLVSEARLRESAMQHRGGVDEFRDGLQYFIVLPADPALRPAVESLRRARELRKWMG